MARASELEADALAEAELAHRGLAFTWCIWQAQARVAACETEAQCLLLMLIISLNLESHESLAIR